MACSAIREARRCLRSEPGSLRPEAGGRRPTAEGRRVRAKAEGCWRSSVCPEVSLVVAVLSLWSSPNALQWSCMQWSVAPELEKACVAFEAAKAAWLATTLHAAIRSQDTGCKTQTTNDAGDDREMGTSGWEGRQLPRKISRNEEGKKST